MNWKARQLFSNREQGIMSGLDPIPMMGGGSVPYPGMQNGGPVMNHTHPELHSHGQSKIDPGFIRERSPETGALLPKMQTGGMVGMDLFEEGDQDVNEALNMMATVANPEVPDMPATNGAAPMMEETVEVTETITEDQGPNDFRKAVDELKATFLSEIDQYISEGGGKNLGKYLTNMGIVYSNELKKLREKYNVTIESPEDQLFTEAFLSEAMGNIPEMQDGGLFGLVNEVDTQEELDKYGIQYPLDVWRAMKKDRPESAQILLLASIAQMNAAKAGTTGGTTDTTRLDDLLQERRNLSKDIGEAARSGYASIGSTGGHFLGARSAGRQAELSARDAALADEIAAERAALTAGTSTGGGKITFPADTLNAIFGVSGDDAIDLSNTFVDLIENKKKYGEPDAELRAIVDFAELNELPYFNAYRGKKLVGKTPTDWITYYKATLAAEKNKLGNKFPDRNSDPDEYYKIAVQIVKDWNTLQDA